MLDRCCSAKVANIRSNRNCPCKNCTHSHHNTLNHNVGFCIPWRWSSRDSCSIHAARPWFSRSSGPNTYYSRWLSGARNRIYHSRVCRRLVSSVSSCHHHLPFGDVFDLLVRGSIVSWRQCGFCFDWDSDVACAAHQMKSSCSRKVTCCSIGLVPFDLHRWWRRIQWRPGGCTPCTGLTRILHPSPRQ